MAIIESLTTDGIINAIAAEALLARDASNLTSGTVNDSLLPEASQALSVTNASNLTSGTVDDSLLPVPSQSASVTNASNLASGTVDDSLLPITAQAATLDATYMRKDANYIQDLTAGENTISRLFVTSSTIPATSGLLYLTYFTATKNEDVDRLRIVGGSIAAGETPSLVRAGIYSINEDYDLTLIAAITSDTNLFADPSTVYLRSLNTTITTVSGTRYAYGLLVVTSTTEPSLAGAALTVCDETEWGPKLSACLTGQTNLPSSILSGELLASSNLLYGVLVPSSIG